MSLVTNVQRDIDEYEEKVFFGLTARKLLCVTVTVVLVALEILVAYFLFHVTFDNIPTQVIVVLTAVVGFALGYTKPMGMTVEKAAPIWLRQHFGKNVVVYKSSVALEAEEAAAETDKGGRGKDGKNTGKIKEQARKDYRRITKYRGVRSPEYIIPRYYAATAAQALTEGAARGDEGIGG